MSHIGLTGVPGFCLLICFVLFLVLLCSYVSEHTEKYKLPIRKCFFLEEFCERPVFEKEISGENQYVAEEKGKIMFKVVGGKTSFLSLIGQERYTIK